MLQVFQQLESSKVLLISYFTALAVIWLLAYLLRPSPTNDSDNIFPPNTTFRLQGIPAFVSAQPVSKETVVRLLKNAWGINNDITVTVHSLATDPLKESKKIATLSFQPSPQSILRPARRWTRFLTEEADGPMKLVLDVEFLGLTPFHHESETDCTYDIVALSGLNDHVFDSFEQRGEDSSFMWLRDALPQHLTQAGVHARVFIYGYDSRLVESNSFQDILDLGNAFKDTMVQLTQNSAAAEKRGLILLGHSLGGIVVKQAIISLDKSAYSVHEERTLERLLGLILFATPNQGMDIETLLPMVSGKPNEMLVRTLAPSTSVLRNQMEDFHRLFERTGFSAFWYYETKESATAEKCSSGEWKMTGSKRKLVDISSATNGMPYDYGRHMVRPINRSHSEIVKFHGPTDEVYKQVLADIKAIAPIPSLGLLAPPCSDQNFSSLIAEQLQGVD